MHFNSFSPPGRKNFFATAITAVLVLAVIALGSYSFMQAGTIKNLKDRAQINKTNALVADFFVLFVQKVLQADGEVSFDDRLRLEQAVYDINDPELLAQWEKFTSSSTESQIQENVTMLFAILAKKLTAD